MPPKIVRTMTLNCPTCAIALIQRPIRGETVDRCNTCNGTWYDSTELSSILRGTTALESSASQSVSSPETINCPKCEIKISSTVYAHDSGIPILKCSRCSGVWLVNGQLERIIEYRNGPHKTDKLGRAIAESYAQSNTLFDLIQSRMAAIVFALITLVVSIFSGADTSGVLRIVAFLILPLACIWFSDAMGNLTGIRMGLTRPAITSSTPGFAVALGGWVLMFAVFAVMIYGTIVR